MPCKSASLMLQENLPAEIYHSETAHISKHGLDQIRVAPYLYKQSVGRKKEQSPSMRWGELVHAWILEPQKAIDEFAVAPEGLDRRTKAGKEWALEVEESGKRVVTHAESVELMEMHQAAMDNEEFRNILKKTEHIELSVFWEDDAFGVQCRARPDMVGKNFCADLKTTSGKDFTRDAWNYRYHVQAAFYLHGLRKCGIDARDFYFVTIETEWPYFTKVLKADEIFVAKGEEEFMKDLASYKTCLVNDHWPKPESFGTLSIPNWIK